MNPKNKNAVSSTEKKAKEMLFQAFADLSSKNEAAEILKSLFGESELNTVAKKANAAYLLERGETYSKIKKELKLSSATISNISEKIKNKDKGYELLLKKIALEKWAEKWAGKINNLIEKAK
jgi:TrpR-related protein YerC/YecD